MKTRSAKAAGAASLFVTNVTLAQSRNMMGDGMWGSHWMGGYDGMWLPVVVLALVVVLVVWIVKRGGK
jgi:uncharacterized membrane protein